MLCSLCDGDVLKLQELYKLTLKTNLNHLSYLITKRNLKKT